MNKTRLAALKKSVEHWQDILSFCEQCEGKQLFVRFIGACKLKYIVNHLIVIIDFSDRACELCKLYMKKRCVGCPLCPDYKCSHANIEAPWYNFYNLIFDNMNNDWQINLNQDVISAAYHMYSVLYFIYQSEKEINT